MTAFMSDESLSSRLSTVKFLMVRLICRLPRLGIARQDFAHPINRQRL
jgi:hypothetical protein